MKLSRVAVWAAAGLAIGVALTGFTSPSGPAGEHADAIAKFQSADRDSDGALSLAEVQGVMPGLASQFDSLDHDKDGKLSQFEIHHPFLGAHGGMGAQHGKYQRPAAPGPEAVWL